MSSVISNLIVLTFCWALAVGGGVWITFFKQPAEMERLEKAEQVAKMKTAELSALSAEVGATRERAEEVRARWDARYKVIPRDLGSEEVIAFLNEHTSRGFESLDVTFKEHREQQDYNSYIFDITGRAPFDYTYGLIWAIENDRVLYRVHDLSLNHMDLIRTDPETGRQSMQVVVTFSFQLQAFYGGAAGLSAGDDGGETPAEDIITHVDPMASLPPIPKDVLPTRRTDVNPFYPLILNNIPPNTDNLVDMEKAELVSIAGNKAIFEWGERFVSVAEGESVYLGQLISVDPRSGRVTARLNKGGIIDEVSMDLDTGDLYKQALGPIELTPAENY